MKDRIKLIAALTIAPAIAWWISSSAQVPTDLTALIQTLSLAALAIGLLLPALIWLAGQRASSDRNLLLSLFRPGIYVTIGLVTLLVLAHGLLLAGAIAAVSDRVNRVVIGLAIGGIAGAWVVARNGFSMAHDVLVNVFGKQIDLNQEPEFRDFLHKLAKDVGTEPPDNVALALDGSFFVTEAKVETVNGTLSGRTLVLSLFYGRIFTIDEMKAVVAHELGHFHGDDTKFSQKFYPIYRGASNALAAAYYAREESGWLAKIAVVPAVGIMEFFLNCFSEAESQISREREFAADRVSVQQAGAGPAASALVKAHAFNSEIDATLDEIFQNRQSEIAPMPAYAALVSQNAKREALAGLAEQHTPHPTDSHPPLSQRLQAIGTDLESIGDASLSTQPAVNALSLFRHADQVAAELASHLRQLAAQRSGQIAPPAFAQVED
jgi:hypothetical protein